jgi:L-ascorbate metabolism protein UlaG (beta-lactamase superfamily)
MKDLRVLVYGNSDVADVLSDELVEVNIAENGKEFQVAGFKTKPIDLPHCKMLWCRICDETVSGERVTRDKRCKLHPTIEPGQVDGPPNTGFLINSVFFHPGDGIELRSLKVDNAAIPITGPTISYEGAWNLAISLQAKKIFPMHYSNPAYIADPDKFASEKKGNAQVVILKNGETAQI